MPLTEITTDRENLTITVVSTYSTGVETVWRLWSEPSLREQWWGPPGYPASFDQQGLAPGAVVKYHMTGPDGTRYPGWWRVVTVDAPNELVFEDGFADADGNVDETMPSSVNTVSLESSDGVVTMRIEGRYQDLAALEKVLAMGVEDGLRGAIGQIDDLIVSLQSRETEDV